MKKISYTFILLSLLLCTGNLWAQDATAEDNIKQMLIADWERAKTYTLEYIEAMPEDGINYTPVEGIRTFAEQMLHLSQGNIGLSANGSGADRIYAEANLEKTDSYKNKESLKEIVAECYDYVIKSIEDMDSSTYYEVVERGPFKVNRLGWLNKAFEHQTHHRGQCAIYFRVKGMEAPKAKLF